MQGSTLEVVERMCLGESSRMAKFYSIQIFILFGLELGVYIFLFD